MLLETFLRGMETIHDDADVPAKRALKPSLEGWKHAPPYPPMPAQRALETFLRGMETSQAKGGRQGRGVP